MADLGVLSYLGKGDVVMMMKRAERKQHAVCQNKMESEVARWGLGAGGTRG